MITIEFDTSALLSEVPTKGYFLYAGVIYRKLHLSGGKVCCLSLNDLLLVPLKGDIVVTPKKVQGIHIKITQKDS